MIKDIQIFFFASDYDFLQSENNKHAWYFEQILEHIVYILSHVSYVSAWVCCVQNDLIVWWSSVICDPEPQNQS